MANKLKLDNIPKENRVLTCPYCNSEQNEFNYEHTMYTDTNWVLHTCDKCKKDFAFIQFVERIYVTAELKE